MTRGVLVAGAGPGVSGSLARVYAAEGCALGLLGVDQEALDELAQQVEERGGRAVTAVADLTDDAATREAVEGLVEQLGVPLHVVHFNPSAYRPAGPLVLSVDDLLADVRLGVGALLTVLQAARPHLVAGGRVTATGSMAADRPDPAAASLGVQKAGLRNLVHSIDAALRDHGIRAVSVTVRGTLAKEGAFTPDRVAAALRAAIDQPEDEWRTELSYSG
jgi:NAD(P)-dependent dehydrogenase (short-subunit alcohol dehydrogenase family)